MARTRKLLVLRPGSVDRGIPAGLAAHGDFRTIHVDSADCSRPTSIGIRYNLSSREICDLLVLPCSELSCVRLIEGSPPVVIAYGPVEMMESAFLLGARDYLVEPWTLRELLVRSRRALGGYPSPGGLDYYDGALLRAGRFVSLTERERRVFELLLRHTGRIIDRETLGITIGVSADQLRRGSRAVDMAVSRVRRALADSGAVIEPIRGIGYRLRVDNRWINTSGNVDRRKNG